MLTTTTAGSVADAIDWQTIRRWNVVEQIFQSSDDYSIFRISQYSAACEQLWLKYNSRLTFVVHGGSFNERDAGFIPDCLVEVPDFYRSNSLSLLKLERM